MSENVRVQEHHEFYIVGEKNERIATTTIYFKKGGLWLTDVWVHPDHRRNGSVGFQRTDVPDVMIRP